MEIFPTALLRIWWDLFTYTTRSNLYCCTVVYTNTRCLADDNDHDIVLQVCLMSQSMANMHAWATNSMLNTQLKASTVHMCRWKQHWTLNLCYYGVDHTPHCRPRAAARIHCVWRCSLSSNLPPDYDKEQTLPRWPAEQVSRNARHLAPFVCECVSMAPRP